MTEQEWGLSTYARVMALYRIQILGWAQTRDFFSAQASANFVNCNSAKGTSAISTADVLAQRYPRPKEKAKVNLDRGVLGWRVMKDSLKGITDKAKRKLARRKVANV